MKKTLNPSWEGEKEKDKSTFDFPLYESLGKNGVYEGRGVEVVVWDRDFGGVRKDYMGEVSVRLGEWDKGGLVWKESIEVGVGLSFFRNFWGSHFKGVGGGGSIADDGPNVTGHGLRSSFLPPTTKEIRFHLRDGASSSRTRASTWRDPERFDRGMGERSRTQVEEKEIG